MSRTTPLNRTPFAAKPKKEKTDRPARITHKRGQSTIWRSEAYLALVRTLPCVCCGVDKLTQPAHSNQLKHGKGRSIKASDASAMALCGPRPLWDGCHAQHDQGGKLRKAEWKAFENEHIVRTIIALVNQGRLKSDCLAPDIPRAIGPDFEFMASHLVGMIESGELKINQQ